MFVSFCTSYEKVSAFNSWRNFAGGNSKSQFAQSSFTDGPPPPSFSFHLALQLLDLRESIDYNFVGGDHSKHLSSNGPVSYPTQPRFKSFAKDSCGSTDTSWPTDSTTKSRWTCHSASDPTKTEPRCEKRRVTNFLPTSTMLPSCPIVGVLRNKRQSVPHAALFVRFQPTHTHTLSYILVPMTKPTTRLVLVGNHKRPIPLWISNIFSYWSVPAPSESSNTCILDSLGPLSKQINLRKCPQSE